MNDATEITTIIQAFYALFDNRNARRPEFEKLMECCIPQSLIIQKSGEREDVYSIQAFWEPREKLLTDGSLIDFHESELTGKTAIIGNIAHHLSRYQKNGFLNGEVYSGEGNKSFQLMKTNEGWKICSIVWEDDSN